MKTFKFLVTIKTTRELEDLKERLEDILINEYAYQLVGDLPQQIDEVKVEVIN